MHQSRIRDHGTFKHLAGMTSAETSAASFDPLLAERKGISLRRWLAPFAVGIALLSAFLTFVVLTGLTPIEPTRDVVRSFLMINGVTILLLVGIIVREIVQSHNAAIQLTAGSNGIGTLVTIAFPRVSENVA